MTHTVFERSARLPAAVEAAWAWHARPGALPRLTPPWERVWVEEAGDGLRDGSVTVLRVPAGPLKLRWIAEHRDVVLGAQFRDVQLKGPFRHWDHLHTFAADGPAASTLTDRIEYALPMGWLGRLVGGRSVRRKLARMFAWRHRTTADDLAAHARYGPRSRMRVLVSGASGLVGGALAPFLATGGHEVVPLRRGPAGTGPATWDPDAGSIDLAAAGPLDAVVHLAGENIAGGRWTEARKQRIRDSRVAGTRLLARALADLEPRPRVLVCASATSAYAAGGDAVLTEDSPAGEGFLEDLARDWEAAAEPARQAGIRVVHLRIGLVLDPRGGLLGKMLPPFRLGLGARVGPKDAWLPWIALDDLLGIVLHAIGNPALHGSVNACAPNPVRNAEFVRTLGRVLRRPAFLAVPAPAARLLLGEMYDAAIARSYRLRPARLEAVAHDFRHPGLEAALRHLLGRPGPGAAREETASP